MRIIQDKQWVEPETEPIQGVTWLAPLKRYFDPKSVGAAFSQGREFRVLSHMPPPLLLSHMPPPLEAKNWVYVTVHDFAPGACAILTYYVPQQVDFFIPEPAVEAELEDRSQKRLNTEVDVGIEELLDDAFEGMEPPERPGHPDGRPWRLEELL